VIDEELRRIALDTHLRWREMASTGLGHASGIDGLVAVLKRGIAIGEERKCSCKWVKEMFADEGKEPVPE
jgi:hypothetical protein